MLTRSHPSVRPLSCQVPTENLSSLDQLAPFVFRHLGPREDEIATMLERIGFASLEELVTAVVPHSIRMDTLLNLRPGVTEEVALEELKGIAIKNRVLKSFIGQGYYGTHTPKVIQRNVLENPAWYTAYTPYQPEISQGRLEVLFYFQTLIAELTGLEIANASLLDEATAASEAMTLCLRGSKTKATRFIVSRGCHPQTIDVLRTRSEPLGIQLEILDTKNDIPDWSGVFGIILQYPATDGSISNHESVIASAHQHGAMVVMATDLLALMLLKSPGELGADIAVGSSQRFGVPLGFGGPHAAFLATTKLHQRTLPGRLVGQSIDSRGKKAFRLALQTREQHIRREKATSNICTAQALLAIMATLYAMYHGPEGLRQIAWRVHKFTTVLYRSLQKGVYRSNQSYFFDTIVVETGSDTIALLQRAIDSGFNLRKYSETQIAISLDETTTTADLIKISSLLDGDIEMLSTEPLERLQDQQGSLTQDQLRNDCVLTQEVFHKYRSETEMMRYVRRLSEMDIALDRSMIPLGSCTMKLNAASELTPITWPEWNSIHPFAPSDQAAGYHEMIADLEAMLCEITGYDAVSLQPNAGSQGEYAGLLAIKGYHESRNDFERDICLIPSSAHGTNPASAQMANMKVVVVKCDDLGNVDLDDLDLRLSQNQARVAAIMITYPSTHGVFEDRVLEVCAKVHSAGGQVYIDGANLNALVGLAQPGKFGGDVSHLNLHKTFCIPHGGGGPGVGPVAVKSHLAPFLPKDTINHNRRGSAVSAAPFGSASILPISWMYIRMMGAAGLRMATQVAILNANYIAHELKNFYPILYTGNASLVAHECIIDTRPMEKAAGVTVDDVAKRLMDYGFHGPTMSFPVAGTLMIEPTESESLTEINRFCRAMKLIHAEYLRVLSGEWSAEDNPMRNAPHTLDSILSDAPARVYTRREAVCPDSEMDYSVKYWPPVGRVDNVFGDRNVVCSCPPMQSFMESTDEIGEVVKS